MHTRTIKTVARHNFLPQQPTKRDMEMWQKNEYRKKSAAFIYSTIASYRQFNSPRSVYSIMRYGFPVHANVHGYSIR